MGVLVGRAPALAQLRERWERAAQGARQFVLVGGEAGIGKTRLVSEFAQRAHAEGAQVFLRALGPRVAGPYQPFITAIQHYMANRVTLAIPRELEPELRELARFVPALRSRLDGAEPIAEDPETRRYRLFQAVARMFAYVAGDTPSVLVLDDLQWADSSTALLLSHVWHDPAPVRLLVLATFREPGETPCRELVDGLATIRRGAAFTRLALAGLDAEETSALVAQHSPSPAAQRDVERLRERTEGNPFFIVETLRTLDNGAGLDAAGVPEGVKDLIARRLARLSQPANEALAAGAVAGREFRLPVLEALLAKPAERVLGALRRRSGSAWCARWSTMSIASCSRTR